MALKTAPKKDNLPLSLERDSDSTGTITYANEVIAIISGVAANEVEGVAGMTGSGGSLADILGRRGQSSRNLTKGVKVDVQDGKVQVHVGIIIDYGSPVPEVATNIQENVKKAVETMSGLSVSNIDVHVQAMSFERENRATAEIEMKQRILLQKQDAKPEQDPESEFDPDFDPDFEPEPADETPIDDPDE